MSYTNRKAADFEILRIRGWKLWISTRFPSQAIAPMLPPDGHNGVRGPFERVSSSRFSRVYRCRIGFFGTVHNLYLKQYLHRSAWDILKHLFRPSRAERAFKASLMLIRNGLLSPKVIAVGELKYGLLCTRTFLVTREVDNARSVCDLLADDLCGDNHNIGAQKRSFICEFAHVVGRMHAVGIFHGDLRLGNVLARKVDGGWEFFFLDNERTRKVAYLPLHLRIKNLVQISMLRAEAITNTDRLLFARVYFRHNPVSSAVQKAWIRRVVSKTNKRLQKKAASM